MIRYNRQIELDLRRSGEWQIKTDRGDIYKTMPYSDITPWWNTQVQNEFRSWQKDIVVADTANIFGKLTLFNVFKQGKGYNQNHDICLVHSELYKIWVLSTANDFWICQNDGGNIIFDVKDSLGSIMKPEDRKIMYSVYDNLKQQFNPNYECRWISY